MRAFFDAFLRYVKSDRRAIIIIALFSCVALGLAGFKCLSAEESTLRKDLLEGFNPNKVDSLQLSSYGLTSVAVDSWMDLLKQGKKLHSMDDLKEVKGLAETDKTVLEPFIQFPRKSHYTKKGKRKSGKKGKSGHEKKKKKR
jgi:hypothetical protein